MQYPIFLGEDHLLISSGGKCNPFPARTKNLKWAKLEHHIFTINCKAGASFITRKVPLVSFLNLVLLETYSKVFFEILFD